MDINRTVLENEQAEMKHKCRERESLLKQIKVYYIYYIIIFTILYIPELSGNANSPSIPLPQLLWLARETEHDHLEHRVWAIVLPKFRPTCRNTHCHDHVNPGSCAPPLWCWASTQILGRVPEEMLQNCCMSIMPNSRFNIKGSSAILSETLIALTSCGKTRHLMCKLIK